MKLNVEFKSLSFAYEENMLTTYHVTTHKSMQQLQQQQEQQQKQKQHKQQQEQHYSQNQQKHRQHQQLQPQQQYKGHTTTYIKQQQQQHKQHIYLVKENNRKSDSGGSGSGSGNGTSLYITAVWLLLLLWPLCCCRSYASAYSVKLDNCYDINSNGYNSARLNGTAPTHALTGHNVTWAAQFYGNGDLASSPLLPQQQIAEDRSTTITMLQHQQRLFDLLHNRTATEMSTATAKTTTSTLPNIGNTSNDWKCCCWNATMQNEVECRCEGDGLTRVPQTLTVPVQILTIAIAGLPRVRSTGLTVYAATLMDVVFTDLKELECIQDGAFSSLRLLRTIYISHAPKLLFLSKDVFLGISDTIKTIRIINSGLLSVPDLIHLPPKNILQMIDLDNNHITRIEKKSINIKTEQLILANNEISYIDDSAFHGSQIAKLILKENRALRDVHPNAFNGTSMQELDLSSTSLVRLPSIGLQEIEVLRIENTYALKTIPSIYNFKNLQKAYLTHSFHCCAFKFPSRHDPQRHAQRMQEIEKWQRRCIKTSQSQPSLAVAAAAAASATDGGVDMTTDANRAMRGSASGSSKGGARRTQRSTSTGGGGVDVSITIKETDDTAVTNWHLDDSDGIVNTAMSYPNGGIFFNRMINSDFKMPSGENNETELMQQQQQQQRNDILSDVSILESDLEAVGYMSDENGELGVFHENITINADEMQLDEYCGNFTFRSHEVLCYPMPDALNPCEDVMGYQWLRISVWIVVTLAVVGNVAVLVVILSIRTDTSVPRFLMCHLAFADLCLGLYLLLIASIDAHSMGEFFNYAYDWQYGAGCKVAGFLTVFASHLSVFTLTVITIERWLAITQALFLNKRLKLKTATYIMFGGWMYAIFMSSLPLFGISNYSSTSICLPMEIGDFYDIVYLVLILALNGTAFCIIAICYAQIYLSLGRETRHAHHAHTGDMSIAKKMALLVFTNFACCAPIAFFGLTALAGYPLINVTKSKILLVFFYPLNSCADPYLYAILTAQYRQDLYTLLSKFGICKEKALKYKESISLPANTNCTTLPLSRHSLARKSLQGNKLPETQLMLQNNEIFV